MSSANSPDSNSQQAMATLRAVLAEINWDVLSEERDNNILVNLNIEDVPVSYAQAAISDELELFVFYIILSLVPPIERRNECALHITRINHGILIGSFELDFDTGELCFKNGINFYGSVLQAQQIRNVILDSMQTVELYIDTIVAVANNQTSQDTLLPNPPDHLETE